MHGWTNFTAKSANDERPKLELLLRTLYIKMMNCRSICVFSRRSPLHTFYSRHYSTISYHSFHSLSQFNFKLKL